MTDARIAFFGLVVEDMARSLAFYRLAGLDLPAEADQEPHVEADLGGVKLVWDTVGTIKSFDPDWTPPTGGHRVAIAFGLPDPAAVDAGYAAFGAAGYTQYKAPWDAFWGQRYAIVQDPDGNHVELCAPLPSA
ncbi:catechol 2,3-dioxygenase-like lactoylglutathione lyase family enzyme [Actinokineospora baliensis]|uniref:VOC family protein n=1 Tax=Actinokineospora baliensis TaxID=547056 RepID=UPI0027DBE7FD|nr:VOC family protein [Actinokineospora baliensis]MBM7774871.1 catechol 2,3-dioxygenase-like lactoylglutathione lyase family enzyme [Actinokineospora baliensis]